jgi:uncharacterized Zn finger protein
MPIHCPHCGNDDRTLIEVLRTPKDQPPVLHCGVCAKQWVER